MIRAAIATSTLFLLLAGCVAELPKENVITDPLPPSVPGAVAALEACAFDSCYEPTVAVDPQGRIFVTDGWTGPVAVSTDGGRNFTTRDAPPTPDRAPGLVWAEQADVLVQVAPSGRLYWSAIVIDNPLGIGGPLLTGIQVAWSDDGAESWAGNVLVDPAEEVGSPVVFPDRQWLAFAPDGTIYLSYNQVATGIWTARSDDGGLTWTTWVRAATIEGRGGGAGQSGTPVVGDDGTVYLPACGRDGEGPQQTLVLRSADKGASWQSTAVDTGGCNWFPMLAAHGGTLALAVQDGRSVKVAFSTDGGLGFSEAAEWAEKANAAPWPTWRADGTLAVAWFEPAGEGAASLHVRTGDSTALGPIFDVGTALGAATRTTAQTDFASSAWTPAGDLVLVWVENASTHLQLVPASALMSTP